MGNLPGVAAVVRAALADVGQSVVGGTLSGGIDLSTIDSPAIVLARCLAATSSGITDAAVCLGSDATSANPSARLVPDTPAPRGSRAGSRNDGGGRRLNAAYALSLGAILALGVLLVLVVWRRRRSW